MSSFKARVNGKEKAVLCKNSTIENGILSFEVKSDYFMFAFPLYNKYSCRMKQLPRSGESFYATNVLGTKAKFTVLSTSYKKKS